MFIRKRQADQKPLNCIVLYQLICQWALGAAHIWYGLHTAFTPPSPSPLTFKCNFESWKLIFPWKSIAYFQVWEPGLWAALLSHPGSQWTCRRCCPAQKQSHSSGTVKWANNESSALFDWDVIFIALTHSRFSCSLNVYSHWHWLLKKFQLQKSLPERNPFAFHTPEGPFKCPNVLRQASSQAWSSWLSSGNSNLLHWWGQERDPLFAMSNTSYCLLRLCQTQASPKVIKRVHRIIESLGLEGTYQGHLVQPP